MKEFIEKGGANRNFLVSMSSRGSLKSWDTVAQRKQVLFEEVSRIQRRISYLRKMQKARTKTEYAKILFDMIVDQPKA